jgi:hypothetical protein
MSLFPSSPLKFRTAGFPWCHFKADISGSAFPSPNPVCICPSRRISGLGTFTSALCLAGGPSSTPSCWLFVPSQWPSLRSGLCCPGSSTPNDHIRPTRQHNPTSHPAYTDGLRRASHDVEASGELHLTTSKHPASGSELSWLICADVSPSVAPGNPTAAYVQSLHHRRWLSSIARRFNVSD